MRKCFHMCSTHVAFSVAVLHTERIRNKKPLKKKMYTQIFIQSLYNTSTYTIIE
jgi:hypothetical protein